jgi:hypothetical protein
VLAVGRIGDECAACKFGIFKRRKTLNSDLQKSNPTKPINARKGGISPQMVLFTTHSEPSCAVALVSNPRVPAKNSQKQFLWPQNRNGLDCARWKEMELLQKHLKQKIFLFLFWSFKKENQILLSG